MFIPVFMDVRNLFRTTKGSLSQPLQDTNQNDKNKQHPLTQKNALHLNRYQKQSIIQKMWSNYFKGRKII